MSEVATAAPVATSAPAEGANPTAQTNMPVTPASKAGASEPKAEAAPKTAAEEFFDVPVNGKTVKMTRADLLKEASLSKGAFQKFEEAAKMRREAENVLSRLRDPREAVKLLNDPKMGLDKNQIREAFEEWYSENVIKPAEMSPEQKRAHEAEQKMADYERQLKEYKQKEEELQNRHLDTEAAQTLQQEIIGLIEKSGLPKTRFTTSRIAYWLRVNEAKGLNAPADLILKQVQKETRDVMGSLVEASDGDMLVNLLGENTVKKLRAYDLARIRAKRGQVAPAENAQPEEQQPKTRETITESEWKRRLRDWN